MAPRRTLFLLLVFLFSGAAATGCRAETTRTAEAHDRRAEFRELLFQGRPTADLQPQPLSNREIMGLVEERIRITTERGEAAVVALVRPAGDPRPRATVIVQHFLGGTKDDLGIQAIMQTLASLGYQAAAIDGRFRGERQRGQDLYEAIAAALESGEGYPWLLDTVFDVLRTVDYLETRPDVDREKIGMLGISEGGMVAWLAAAADERLRVVAPVVAVTRFSDLASLSLGDAQTTVPLERALAGFARELGEEEVNQRVWRAALERLLPGCFDRFEATELVPLIAPRPLLIVAHEEDELIPLAGTQAVHAAALARYRALEAEERLKLHVSPGLKHAAVDLAALTLVADWLQKWLPAS